MSGAQASNVEPEAVHLAVRGTAYHAPLLTELEVLCDVVIGVDQSGVIRAIAAGSSLAGAALWEQATVQVRLGDCERLMPGFVDLHLHAPQWPQLGTGLDLGLEEWLFQYTFPLEAKYADLDFAQEVWGHMVPTLLGLGTTTAVYFGSIHLEATLALGQQCRDAGQRAFVGRVAMDHPEGTPDWYRDPDALASVEASAASVQQLRALNSTLIHPILTPRFVPACTPALLEGIGHLAADTGTLVQTHCSESDWEHGYVKERYGCRDTELLHQHGLIRPGTVLAHGNHLTDQDFGIISSAAAGVAHCPVSNAYFANAVFPAARAHRHGVGVGLGSDVAGGSAAGMAGVAASAVTVSRLLADGVDPMLMAHVRKTTDASIDLVTAFHMATAGGADVLGLPVGRFQVGQIFDAIAVDADASESGLRWWGEVDSEIRLWEKMLRLMGAREISAVWVAGTRRI